MSEGTLFQSNASCLEALEKSAAETHIQLSGLSQLISELINKAIVEITQKVTLLVTSNIKTWISDPNRLRRRSSPFKDLHRPSKFNRSIDLSENSEDTIETSLGQGAGGPAMEAGSAHLQLHHSTAR